MNLHWLDIVMLVMYMIGMLVLGWWFSKKNTNTEEYFVGGRSYAGWVIGLSLVGTSISSITFLAYPADAFKTAWLRFLPNLMMPLGILIATRLFLPFFRHKNITSAYEYLEDRFGPSIRVYGSITFVFGQLVRVSIILYLISLVLHEMLGVDPVLSILIAGGFVAIYTVIGGIDAVIWTDVIQTIVLMLGGIISLIVIINLLPGGLGQIFSVAFADGKFGLSESQNGQLVPSPWGLSLQEKTVSMMLLLGLVNWLTEYSSNQNVVQRYAASKSIKEARKAMWIGVSTSLPIWTFYMFLGTSMYVLFKVFPTVESAEVLSGVRKAEQIFPFFIMNYLPPGITGLVIAAALAAAMSSLDSSINAIATVSVTDFYRRYFAPNREDRHYLKAAWSIAGAAAAFMIGGAIILSKTDSRTMQDTATILVSLLGGGLLGMYLLGFLTRKGDARSVWFGIVFTMAFTGWTILAKNNMVPEMLQAPFDLYYTGIFGNLIMFLVGYLFGLVWKSKDRNLQNLTVWD
ncbi:sodium:solute symporter [candidate division KSB1 bacterium]|nr:sodium:solute symporter [candidate division KSB1 bacterium]